MRLLIMSFLIKLFLLIKCVIVVASKVKRPNVMIIFADDLGTGDVPGYWNNSGLVNMPNFENLVSTGTTFLDAHSTPLCAPSRYVLLSGNYQHKGTSQLGSWNLNYKGSQFREGQQSMAEVFRNRDYNTAMYGKWHLGGKIPTKQNFIYNSTEQYYNNFTKFALSCENHDWTQPLIQGPWDIGFSESYITVAGIQKPPFAFLRNSTFEQKVLDNITHWQGGTYAMPHGTSKILRDGDGSHDWDSTAYNMILVNETEKFLENHVQTHNSSKPFFTYVSLGGVHIPHSPPDKYIDGSKISGQYKTDHMDLLGEMDKVLGSLIKILEEKELLKDTIIVFTSDNGGVGKKNGSFKEGHKSSGPLREAKGSIFEGGHRIPMVIRWDNGMIPRGETRDRVVGLNDLFATLCDLVGIKVPKGQATDSISFANYIMDENNTKGARESLGVWRYNGNPFRLSYSSLRKGEWKLIYNHKRGSSKLYNLSKDISEMDDVAMFNIDKVNELFDEMKLIGPCVDKAGSFHVRRDKVTGKNKRFKRRNCMWFRKRKRRCNTYPEGRLYCGLTCAVEREEWCNTIIEETTR